MLKKPKNKQKTVAEKVAETLMHPNQSGSDSDSADEATAPRVIEYDVDEYELPQDGTTEFRKRNVKLLSEQSAKYKGKIASRKDFLSEEEEDDEDGEEEQDYEKSDSSEDEEALKAFSKALKKKQTMEYKDSEEEEDDNEEEDDHLQDSEDEDDQGEEEEEEDDDEDDDDDDDELDSEDEVDEDTEVISKVNHEAEIQKGLSVQNQLRIWERLLELRINLQKLLNKTNQLPPPQELQDLEHNNSKYKEIQQTTCKQTCALLQNLLSLKNNLCTQFPEMDKAMKPSLKRALPLKEHNSGEPPLKQVNQYLQEGFEEFHSYRNSVLLKWDDRTKLLQPGAGSKKKTFTEEYDIIKKIDNALLNKSLLKEKSQTLKNNTQTDNSEEPTINPNIYDDSDFYHQQLRELIEYKANTTSNMSEVTKQFLELQKLRQKMKKKVDTRASKGRKLRYNVHNKLINFMAPHDNTTWTTESIDELSKSLFV
ncbi:apoptosis antagonizing transcription factor [Cochliomyia hominivorax]